ncbi:actin-binding Rho-activating protein-like [Osmerus mordax]
MEMANDAPPPFEDDRTVCVVSVKGLKENWQRWSNEHQEHQKHNPFSSDGQPVCTQPLLGQNGYGRPQEGSLTQRRGQDAQSHIGREVQELCLVIREMGGGHGEEGQPVVEFGQLFERYVTISNKLVGILLRARKQGLVQFEGEMLWQGQDDHVVITLLQ